MDALLGSPVRHDQCRKEREEIADWAKDVWRKEDKKDEEAEIEKRMMEQNCRILIEQMKMETDEYKADKERLSHVLATVNIPVGLSGTNSLCAKALQVSAEALDVIETDKANLFIGLSDFHQELEEVETMLRSSRKREEKYRSELPEILKRKEKWQREIARLDSMQQLNEQELTKTSKSTFYMSKKKKQYELEIQRSLQSLKASGFKDTLSHEELVILGSEVKEMEEQLRPLRLQLNSYKDLPPDMTQALVKLEEKKVEFQRIETKMAKQMGEISIMQNSP